MSKLGAILEKEIREAIPPFLFFFVLFHLIGLSKAVFVQDYSITSLRAAFTTVGALIVAKAILLVEALPFAKLPSASLLRQTVWRTLLFAAVALLFHMIEEFIPLISKHGGLAGALRAFYGEVSWPHLGMTALWLVAGLFLYCICWELVRIVGADEFKKRLLGTSGSAGRN